MSEEQEVVENFVEFCDSEFGSEIMDKEAEFIEKKLSGFEKVLDVGCGIGSIEEKFEREIIGLDRSMIMLEEANRRSNSLFVRGVSNELPFPNESFEAVFSVATVEFLEDFEGAIDEIVRVLKKEGKILLLILNPNSGYFLKHMEKEESYFQRFKNEPKEIENYLGQYFDTNSNFFLGVEGEEVFDSNDKEEAAIYFVEGEKKSYSLKLV